MVLDRKTANELVLEPFAKAGWQVRRSSAYGLADEVGTVGHVEPGITRPGQRRQPQLASPVT